MAFSHELSYLPQPIEYSHRYDDVAGDDVAGDDMAGDDMAGDDMAGDDSDDFGNDHFADLDADIDAAHYANGVAASPRAYSFLPQSYDLGADGEADADADADALSEPAHSADRHERDPVRIHQPGTAAQVPLVGPDMNPMLRQVRSLRGHDPVSTASKNSEQVQLGQLLVQRGLLTEAALALALEEQVRTGQTLGRLLIDASLVKETDLVATLASQLGLSFVDLSDYPVDKGAVALVSDSLSRRYLALPIGWDGDRLVVAMADPSNVYAIDDIRHLTGREVLAVVATRASIQSAIDKYHRLDTDAENISAQAAKDVEAEDDLSNIREIVEDAPIVKLVNVVITQAVADRASDIHIEPTEHDVRIRYRIDGVLHEEMRAPKNIQAGIISRLKIMADINIAERRIPQDGRVTATVAGRAVDLRVATLPTVHGEKVVMRILDKSNALLQLTDLGFLPENMKRYEQSYRKPYGTILVTGPTGSGKSTTLYATLNIVNDESKNVITVEDPVEYRLPNINQVQVNVKAGLRSRPPCVPSCGPTPTSSSSVRSGTGRRPTSPSRPPSRATWCSPRCTPTTPPAPRCA